MKAATDFQTSTFAGPIHGNGARSADVLLSSVRYAVPRSLVPLLAVAAAFLLGPAPLLAEFLGDLGEREQYGFYPLLVAAAVALAVVKLKSLPATSLARGTWWVAAPLLMLAVATFFFGALFYMRWFAAPGAILALAAIVWRLGGPEVARALVPVGVLLLVIVPPPFHLDEALTRWLQGLAVRGSSGMLDLLRVPHVMTGAVLEIPGHRLMVEEACSGINSLLSVVAFTLLFAFLKRRSAVAVVGLVAAAVWFVLWANIGRITIGAFAQARFGLNLLDGSAHELSGFLLFAVCLGLVMSMDQLLMLVFGESLTDARPRPGSPRSRAAGMAASGAAEGTARGRRPPGVAVLSTGSDAGLPLGDGAVPASAAFARPGWPWWAFATAFACVGVTTHLRIRDCWPASRLPGSISLAPPAKVGSWQLVPEGTRFHERTESFAKYIHRWHYRRAGGLVAEVGLAYPFTQGYHDPAVCYTSAGWSVTGRSGRAESGVAGDVGRATGGEPYFTMDLAKLAVTHGHVLFAAFDERGQWQSPSGEVAPQGALKYRIWLSRRVARLSPTHEVQTLVVSPAPLDAGQRRDVEQLFLEVRGELARQSLGQLVGGEGSEAEK